MCWSPRRSVRASASMCVGFRTGSSCTARTLSDLTRTHRHECLFSHIVGAAAGGLGGGVGQRPARPGGGSGRPRRPPPAPRGGRGAADRSVLPLPLGAVGHVGAATRYVERGVAEEGRRHRAAPDGEVLDGGPVLRGGEGGGNAGVCVA